MYAIILNFKIKLIKLIKTSNTLLFDDIELFNYHYCCCCCLTCISIIYFFRKGSVIFKFTLTFPGETETDPESLSSDLEENGLGNYTTEVKNIEDKTVSFL